MTYINALDKAYKKLENVTRFITGILLKRIASAGDDVSENIIRQL